MSRILLRDFIATHAADLIPDTKLEETEPLVIIDNGRKYLFSTSWHIHTEQDLKRFLSKDMYNTYVDKFYVSDGGRIHVVIGLEKDNENN